MFDVVKSLLFCFTIYEFHDALSQALSMMVSIMRIENVNTGARKHRLNMDIEQTVAESRSKKFSFLIATL